MAEDLDLTSNDPTAVDPAAVDPVVVTPPVDPVVVTPPVDPVVVPPPVDPGVVTPPVDPLVVPPPVDPDPGPGPRPAIASPPAALSNDTPTITRPKAMSTPRPPPPPRPTPAPAPGPVSAPARPESDWASEIADRIDDVVAKVRANTSDRLVGIARWVVYGLLAVVMGIAALVLVVILFFRLLAVIPGPVWIPYLGLGAIFVAVGLLLWAKRTATPAA